MYLVAFNARYSNFFDVVSYLDGLKLIEKGVYSTTFMNSTIICFKAKIFKLSWLCISFLQRTPYVYYDIRTKSPLEKVPPGDNSYISASALVCTTLYQ